MRIIRPAPITSTSASATSATTSADRSRLCEVVAKEPFFKASTRSGRVACSAGITPAMSPESSEIPSANPSTAGSSRTSSSRGMVFGASATRASTPHAASSTPKRPPPSESRTASVKSCRTMRARPLPSAARIANSRSRAAPRARSMLATLAQAMSSTMITAPSSASRTGLTGPTRSSSRGAARRVMPLWSGSRAAMTRPFRSRSALAWAKDVPGLSRPMATAQCELRLWRSLFVYANGTSASAPCRSGSRKPGGITPTIAYIRPSSVTLWPRMCGSLPNSRCQRLSKMTAECGPPS